MSSAEANAHNRSSVIVLIDPSIRAIVGRDYPVVFATLYIFSLLGLAVNLLSDLIYVWIDPRIDFSARAT